LIQAMAKVDGCLLISGGGPLRPALEARIRKLGLENRIHLLGEVEDIAPLYHAADVFVLASIARSEAFGLVQLEAMACGKPVINTALDSGVPFVSQHGITGLTVPPGDPGALALAINKLLDNQDLRLRYGWAARERVHSKFHLDVMVGRILDLYQQMAPLPVPAELGVTADRLSASQSG
jgi:glycosyltransferase involved in cell wall biosynthesis